MTRDDCISIGPILRIQRVFCGPGHGIRMQDAGCRMQDAGCRMQDVSGGSIPKTTELGSQKDSSVEPLIGGKAIFGPPLEEYWAKKLQEEETKSKEFDGVITRTCLPMMAGLHLVGSDLTRTHERSDINLDESLRSEQRKIREQGNTPMRRTKHVASRESRVPGHENQGVGRSNCCDEGDNTTSCHFTQEKRFKKTSSV